MLTCIACSKQLNAAGSLAEDDRSAATPSSKQAIKTLTAQIKDMAVKASSAYKNCKPCAGSSGHDRSQVYMDSYAGSVSERFCGSYRRAGSSGSSPRVWEKEMEAKLKALSSGYSTPASVSSRSEAFVLMEEDEPKEWVAQVEPGVLITFFWLPQCGNVIKRIRFSREIFNKWQAQRWWAENQDRVIELYNVQKFSHHEAPLPTAQLKDENPKVVSLEDSPETPQPSKDNLPHHLHQPTGISCRDLPEHHPMKSCHYYETGGHNLTPISSVSAAKVGTSSVDASARSSSSREIDHSGELSVSNASDLETEWVEQDELGVYITVRSLATGARELRRVRFRPNQFVGQLVITSGRLDATEKGLENLKQDYGGKPTDRGFNNNTCDYCKVIGRNHHNFLEYLNQHPPKLTMGATFFQF